MILGYARISKDDELRGVGVARQSDDITALGSRLDLTLDEILIDNDAGASRYSRKPRPEYNRIVAALEAGSCSTVIFYNLDRLLRQPKQLEHLIDLAEKRPELRLHSVQGTIDLSTPDGIFVARILVAKAAKESDDTSWRSRRALRERAEAGLPGSGVRPYGFGADRITHEPAEVQVIQEAASRVLAGESLEAIVADFNRRGVPTRGGGPWSRTPLQRILLSPRTAGQRQHFDTLHPAVWEPIIPPDMQALIAARYAPYKAQRRARAGSLGRAPRKRWLLGVARCGRCERRLGSSAGGSGPCYVCRGCGVTMNAANLEELVHTAIRPVLTHPLVGGAIREMDHNEEGEEARAELESIERRMEELEVARWVDESITPANYELVKAKLAARGGELAELVPRESPTLIAAQLPLDDAAWKAMSIVDRRDLTATLLRTLEVGPSRTTHHDPERVRLELEPRFGALLLGPPPKGRRREAVGTSR